MLATVGYITPGITGKWPGHLPPSAGLGFADAPTGLGAVSKAPAAGWAQPVAWGAYCELSEAQPPGTAASRGDFGWRLPTGQNKLAAEIANVRLAVVAIIGTFLQDGLTGSVGFDAGQLKDAGYHLRPLKVAGFDAWQHMAVGFDLTRLRGASKDSGLDAGRLKGAGLSLIHI